LIAPPLPDSSLVEFPLKVEFSMLIVPLSELMAPPSKLVELPLKVDRLMLKVAGVRHQGLKSMAPPQDLDEFPLKVEFWTVTVPTVAVSKELKAIPMAPPL
jgi:hypothetical protein